MANNDSIVNNPLRVLGLEGKGNTGLRSMGLVMSRAGLGKTAILVQFALDCMMIGHKVLHVSIGESVEKTRTWYDDIMKLLEEGDSVSDIPAFMKNRMIMTFKASSFSRAILEERVNDLVHQDIFKPECLIIDGFDFANANREVVVEMRKFVEQSGMKMIWFSATCHRDDPRTSTSGVPAPCHEMDDLFDTVLVIKPKGEEMNLDIVKCVDCTVDQGSSLKLDPSTMLVQKG